MSDKYYAPSIEEFHVGFEYEAIKLKEFELKNIPVGTSLQTYIEMNDLVDEWVKLTWSKTCSPENSFNVLRDSNGVTNISVPESVRVKYLDKEDIESLGFVRDMERGITKGSKVYYKGNYILLHDNNGVSIYVVDSAKDKRMMYYTRSNEVYMLNIKNKSELKRLLKQLDINDNN